MPRMDELNLHERLDKNNLKQTKLILGFCWANLTLPIIFAGCKTNTKKGNDFWNVSFKLGTVSVPAYRSEVHCINQSVKHLISSIMVEGKRQKS